MPRFPETLALMEQALRHVLSEQEKLLKRRDASDLTPILKGLCDLALKTTNLIAAGCNRPGSTKHLTGEAKRIETVVDDVSEELWSPIQVSVHAIYERIEQSFQPKAGEFGFAAEVRAHYHNLRIRLLEQMLSARMLASSSDLGDECERIWQQFLERHLGPMFRVLRGGYICDHQGTKSCQIDLIVVLADAQVFVPGESEDGKAHVLIDQIVAAIMVTANLTTKKLTDDWEKLQSLPRYLDFEKDYPQLNGHPWPLCYILAAQSDPTEELQKTWKNLCKDGATPVVPQFVITLDAGFLYCGLRKWPAPRFPSNHRAADDVNVETGLYAGLGLAWLITQLQGRSAVIQGQALPPISRRVQLFDTAMLREAMPATWSPRFWTMFRERKIAGIMEWGSATCWAHNRVELQSLARMRPNATTRAEVEILQPNVDPTTLPSLEWNNHARWFRYPSNKIAGRLLALEEWINHRSKTEHKCRIAVFDVETGEEISGPLVDALKTMNDLNGIRKKIEAEIQARAPTQDSTV